MRTLKLLAKIEHLPQWIAFIIKCAEEQGLPSKRIRDIELAVEEAIVNICHNAYPDETGDLEVTCTVDMQNRFMIEIVDWGRPFDPLELEAPNLTNDLEARQVGGLGVFLIRKLMDDVIYHRDGERNCLQLIVRQTPEG